MNPILLTDFYKVHHKFMYPEGITKIYSNLTARKSRMKDVNSIVFFGLQYFIKEYLIDKFNKEFFQKPLEEVIKEYKFAINTETQHIEKLHQLGYLPIEIKALEEGTLVPIGVPVLTITNTHKDFAWLTNYLETLISAVIWQPITSATIAHEYKKLLDQYALETVGSTEFVQWQGHDFSMRGMQGIESAILSGMGHLTSFTGTDTIPAIYSLNKYYNANDLIGASVPATEHSVMCAGGKEDEIETFERLLDLYPTGILSIVSDTWDLWKVCTEYLPKLKDKILSRDGKLVIRPDSGDPVDIICGIEKNTLHKDTMGWYTNDDARKVISDAEVKGVIELLWDVFGGTINEKGYKVLDSHIGAIYGDSITLERAEAICERLKAKGFASTNIVFGIGSFTYTYNTRDTFGMAVKATYCEVNDIPKEIFKNPVTDDGTKKSAKGLIQITKQVASTMTDEHGKIYIVPEKLVLLDQQTKEQEAQGLLKTVFKDSKLLKETTLEEIRAKLK